MDSIGLWHFDEGAGATTADATGNGHTADHGDDAAWVPGVCGTGTASSFFVSSAGDFAGLTSLSIDLWVRPTGSFGGNLVGMDECCAETFTLELLPAGQIRFTINGECCPGDWEPESVTTTQVLPSSAWSHVRASYEAGGAIALAINATVVVSRKSAITQLEGQLGTLEINGSSGAYLDEVHIALAPDTVAPTGSLVISAAAPYTSSAELSLSVPATDALSGVSTMQLSESPSFVGAPWESYTPATQFSLSAAQGAKTVYGRFRDAAGNTSAAYSDSIILDSVPPTSSVNALPQDQTSGTFGVSWSGSDATSGIAMYEVQYRDMGVTSPQGLRASASAWTPWQRRTSTSWLFRGKTGHRYCFRSRALDRAGLAEAWPASQFGDTCTRVKDGQSPTGRVVINNGAAKTPNRDVLLQLSASDNVKVAQVQISNSSLFGGVRWRIFTRSTVWRLTQGVGRKLVYVRYRDLDGNVSRVFTDSIMLSP